MTGLDVFKDEYRKITCPSTAGEGEENVKDGSAAWTQLLCIFTTGVNLELSVPVVSGSNRVKLLFDFGHTIFFSQGP